MYAQSLSLVIRSDILNRANLKIVFEARRGFVESKDEEGGHLSTNSCLIESANQLFTPFLKLLTFWVGNLLSSCCWQAQDAKLGSLGTAGW